MSLFSRAFDGIPAVFKSPLDAPAAEARLLALKRWAPGKPLLTGVIAPDRVTLAFAPGSGYGRSRSRFEGRLEPAEGGCVLRGRFIGSGPTRAIAALFVAFSALMAFGGLLTGLADLRGGGDSISQVGVDLLGLIGWLCGVALFGCFSLWNAAPSRHEMRDMTEHLAAALDAGDPA